MKKLFTIKKKKLLTIFLEENEFEEIDCSKELSLKNLRNLSKKWMIIIYF